MFTRNDSDRLLTRVLAGLTITVTFVVGAIVHSVVAAQPLI
jgi:hypothetical protein